MEAHNLLFQLKQLFKVNCGYIVGIMIGCLCCSTLYACTDDKLPLKETEVVPPKEDDDPEDKPDSLSIETTLNSGDILLNVLRSEDGAYNVTFSGYGNDFNSETNLIRL